MEAYWDQITIFTEYYPVFAERLLDRTPEGVAKNEKGTLLWLDDLGCNEKFNASDKHFFRLAGQQRHERVPIISIFYTLASQRVISPFLSAAANYYFCFKISN